MNIALIGDVHGNLPALEAVLEHAEEHEVAAVWNVGDFVGYGAFPNEVIERLQQEEVISIMGNYDRKVLEFKKKSDKWRKKKQAQKFLGFQWARHTLTKLNRKYLASLPTERELHEGNIRFLLTHGSPESDSEHVSPATPEERMEELAAMVKTDAVLCGHSHRASDRQVDGVRFINPGSVGRPDDGDPRACYAILQIGDGVEPSLRVQPYRVVYDVDRAVASLREQGLPEAYAQMTINGRELDDVMQAPQVWETPAPAALPWDEEETEQRLDAVLALAERNEYVVDHTHHVTDLVLRLYDELQPFHRLDAEARFWLHCGALLHDIGWVEGQKGHHKMSLRLILKASDLPFDKRERRIIGSIARYHRGALPKDKHDHLTALSPVDQYHVTVLAAMLRVADGLDRTHRNVVEDLACRLTPWQIILTCDVCMYPIPEREAALEKADLLERAFDRELVIDWQAV